MDPSQQNFVYNPGMQPSYPPFVDPMNLQQMAQFQGSYIYPDGTIVNANGEPIAVTLPPSQFASIIPQQQNAENGMGDASEMGNDVNNYVVGVDTDPAAIHESALPSPAGPSGPADILAHAFENTDATERLAEGGFVDERPAGLTTPRHVVPQDVVGTSGSLEAVEIQVGIDVNELPSPAAPSGLADVSSGGAQTFAGNAATPESPEVDVDAEDAGSSSAMAEDDRESASAFTWHQVKAAEGREVPAQEIGWTWNKNAATVSSTSLVSGDKKDEKKDDKEKSFALQVNKMPLILMLATVVFVVIFVRSV